MKKLKLDYLFVAAMVLGSGLALATAEVASREKPMLVAWKRSQSNVWTQGAAPSSCGSASLLCHGTFPDGYDPNANSDSANRANTTTAIVLGYAP